jgi:Skp family chaperone for outer membrane proteins|tara:strand:+ start:506 stop:736 length:231 start_codon:yes stop_codon:yes gene_type:complete
MVSVDEMKEMQEEIRAMETELAEKKKELREAKYAGLRTAMQARKEADEAIKQELKDLGYQSTSFGIPLSSSYHWKF